MEVRRYPVRITIKKKLLLADLVAENASEPWRACERFYEGQQFISEGDMPEGFCSWAWLDIGRYVITLARGGNFLGSYPGRTVVCCSDGYRPVIFLLERLQDSQADNA